MAWTNEKVALLKKLWADGFSASQCASRIGGVTRNAVIGKTIRLGLARRATTQTKPRMGPRIKPFRPRWQGSAPKPEGPPVRTQPFKPRPEPIIPAAERKPLERLEESDCRWPIGEGPFAFCARRRTIGRPYCEDHVRIAYQWVSPTPRPRTPKTSPSPLVKEAA